MTDHSRGPHIQSADPYEDEINVGDWLRMFRGQRRFLVGAAWVGVLGGGLATYMFRPDYVATAQLVVAARPSVQLSSALVATYQAGLESLAVAQHVVDGLGLDKAPHNLSAARLRARTTVSADNATGILTIVVRSADPALASSAVTSLTQYGMTYARRIEERARIGRELGMILKLREELPDLSSRIQGEETAQKVLQEQLQDARLRSESVQREMVLSRVRLAQLRARWDHIVKGIEKSERLSESLDRLPSDSDLPESVASEHELLAGAFGVSVFETDRFESPLRLLSKATVSKPPGLRLLVTNLVLGFVFGLLLAIAISVVLYVVSAGPKPAIPRPTPE